jgi:hypothetical protein
MWKLIDFNLLYLNLLILIKIINIKTIKINIESCLNNPEYYLSQIEKSSFYVTKYPIKVYKNI